MIDLNLDCAELPLREYGDDDVVIKEGGRSGALYFLVEGAVRVSRDGTLLAEITEPGSILGEISILLDRPHTAEVTALGKAVFRIAEDAESFLKRHPEVNLDIARSLAKKVDTMSCYLVDLKQQYAGESSHLGMVHEVLDSLMHPRG